MHEKNILGIRIFLLLFLTISFYVLALLVMNGSITAFENTVYSVLSRFVTPGLTGIMIFITNIGSAYAIIAVNITFLVLPSTRKVFGYQVAFNSIVTDILNSVLKNNYARERPNILRLITESGYGFPSGHAMNSTALCAIIAFIVFKRIKKDNIRIPVLIFSIFIPFSIGISRVYLGVHRAGDVIAGWIMGMAVTLVVDILWKLIEKS